MRRDMDYEIVNVYQYRSKRYWVNENAFFYKYLYSTNGNLETDPDNTENWTLSNTGISNNSKGIAFRAIGGFIDASAERLGYKPICVYGFHPESSENTESFMLRPINTTLWPTVDPKGFKKPITKPGTATIISPHVYAYGTKDTWPYANCDKLLKNSYIIEFDDTYRIPFYAFTTPVEGTMPVYQYAYRKIWFPGYFVYSIEGLGYDGTGLDPSTAGPTISSDGNRGIAFYAYPPPSN